MGKTAVVLFRAIAAAWFYGNCPSIMPVWYAPAINTGTIIIAATEPALYTPHTISSLVDNPIPGMCQAIPLAL